MIHFTSLSLSLSLFFHNEADLILLLFLLNLNILCGKMLNTSWHGGEPARDPLTDTQSPQPFGHERQKGTNSAKMCCSLHCGAVGRSVPPAKALRRSSVLWSSNPPDNIFLKNKRGKVETGPSPIS